MAFLFFVVEALAVFPTCAQFLLVVAFQIRPNERKSHVLVIIFIVVVVIVIVINAVVNVDAYTWRSALCELSIRAARVHLLAIKRQAFSSIAEGVLVTMSHSPMNLKNTVSMPICIFEIF